ncbi:MAG: hypothetical protein ACTSQP_11620 [Promethearchaeota archaeon]
MTAKISKVLEIDNCPKDLLLDALYKAEFWEKISPVKKIEAKFIAPNVLWSVVEDDIFNIGNYIKIPIKLEGELVLSDKREELGKGHLIEFNVRNNKDVRELEGRLRIKSLSASKTKIGVFINNLILSSNFLNLVGKNLAEITLQTKITKMLRNLEKLCKNQKFLEQLS